jgi:hypothetical protein
MEHGRKGRYRDRYSSEDEPSTIKLIDLSFLVCSSSQQVITPRRTLLEAKGK